VPTTKNPFLRHRIIDRCLRNSAQPFPDKQFLRIACEKELYNSNGKGTRVCNSTIEKDILAMRQEYDAPIMYSRLKKGYYYEDPNFTINDVPLTEADIDAIRFAATTLSQFKDIAWFSEFGNTIDKIVERVSLSLHAKSQDIQQYVQFETSTSSGGGTFLLPLLTAIQAGVAVYFDYENFRKKTMKPRKVRPLLLKEYRNRWYLISYDLSKEMITTYALERISNLEVSQESVAWTQQFDPHEFFKYAVGISTTEGTPELVRLVATDIASKYLTTQPLHSSQKEMDRSDNHATYELRCFVSEELIRDILSYGEEITVLEPQTLRSTIIKRLQQMARNYQL